MRPASIHRQLFVTLGLTFAAATWWGCASGSGDTSSASTTSLSSSTGNGGGGDGTGGGIHFDGGGGSGGGTGGNCSSTDAEAHAVPLDLIFLLDRSESMALPQSKWDGTTSALTGFFNNPSSAAISAGMIMMPFTEYDCDPTHYETFTVPIAPLPENAFNLTNAMPATTTIFSTPMYGALQGTLFLATAHQDANPTHKVAVVLVTDGHSNSAGEPGDPMTCNGKGYADIADLAGSALGYDGVHTYVIGVEGADIPGLTEVAQAGGTNAAYDVTQDINQFSATIAAIRSQALGCDFELPDPPHGKELNPNDVNVSYTPKGMGAAHILPRAQNKGDCGGKPGWYFDNNQMPTTVVLCPSSCSTVKNDDMAKVDVLFGCISIQN